MKYTAHIVSHSHWDREWYLPYEQHHMRLVDLINDILDKIDEEPDFKSFHLDGQTISIEDYLEVHPENFEKLKNAISSGRIKIGPWYILQDAFLTSSEANIRNLQIGHMIAEKFGAISKIGYYPDTFGIYGQAAQIMKKSGIENFFFGRGVSPTGFANKVSDNYESKFSEMIIEAPNGDQVIGILFANWYSNGNEIPVDEKNAKKFWDKKLEDVKKFSASSHLLFMNGCDHQPLQKNITEAIEIANKLYDNIEFIHSSMEEYYSAIKKDLKDKSLNIIKGELRSQNTDGRYTLVNTASSRVYQKQMNVLCQDYFEKIAEPLCAMLLDKNKYPHQKLDYGWKLLMKNHPHDSICGCSIDSVHKSMDERFDSALEVAKFIIQDTLLEFSKNVDTTNFLGELFSLFNPLSIKSDKINEILFNYKKFTFAEHGVEGARILAEKINTDNLVLKNSDGKIIPAIIEDLGVCFEYLLPKDSFRIPFYTRKLKITFSELITPFSWDTYEISEEQEILKINSLTNSEFLENKNLKININKNGSIDLFNKKLNEKFKDQLQIVDEGDVGNEYMFGKIEGDNFIHTNNDLKFLFSEKNDLFQKITYEVSINLPISADEKILMEEQRKLVEYYKRKAKRSNKIQKVTCIITLTLANDSENLDCNIKFENNITDHRMRVLFPTKLNADQLLVDSIFEVAERQIKVSKIWMNEHNDQHQSKFSSLSDGKIALTVANYGLQECEVINDSTLAITILRAVGEMGDWGEFLTKDSQCIGEQNINLSIFTHEYENRFEIFEKARNNFIKFPYVQIPSQQKGEQKTKNKFMELSLENGIAHTSLKKNKEGDLIFRVYNMDKKLSKKIVGLNAYETNLLETAEVSKFDGEIKKSEILTLKIK